MQPSVAAQNEHAPIGGLDDQLAFDRLMGGVVVKSNADERVGGRGSRGYDQNETDRGSNANRPPTEWIGWFEPPQFIDLRLTAGDLARLESPSERVRERSDPYES